MVHVRKGFDILKVEANVSLDLLVFKSFREDFSNIVIKPEHKKSLLLKNI